MFEIDKQFDFCYGHRVHNQELNMELSMNGLCKCRHLHGHNGTLKIGLKAKELERGMVTDFKNLECIKVLVDEVLDHKFIIDKNDPEFLDIVGPSQNILRGFNTGTEIPTQPLGFGFEKIDDTYIEECCWKECFHRGDLKSQSLRDRMTGFVIVDFVPTSENLCRKFAEVAAERLHQIFGDRVSIAYVDFWETPKSHCRYTPEVK